MTTVLELRGASKTVGELATFSDLSFDVARGESVAVLGPSGSGKSTLLACLGLLDHVSAGSLSLGGRPVAQMTERERTDTRASQIGFVFQNFSLIPYLAAWENVAVPLQAIGASKVFQRARSREVLEELNIGHLSARRPAELSGGEQQRVAIARAIVCEPGLVLADEPTGSLDQETGREVIDVLLDACRHRSAALIVVTHDDVVASRMDRRVHLGDPRPAAVGAP